MTFQYTNSRASGFIATDDIPTVQYRRSSRRFSEIKFRSEITESNQNLLNSLKPSGSDEEDVNDYILQEESYAPEGALGWMIVAASFTVNFIVDGISLSYGVMTEDITAKMNETEGSGMMDTEEDVTPPMTVTEFNLVGSTLLAVTLLMGPFTSAFTEKFGFRKTAMAGSVISTIGILLSWGISPDQPKFIPFLIGHGILGGIGFGILFAASVVIVGKYFDKNIAVATGCTVAGTGVGTLTMAPLTDYIMTNYGWQRAIFVQAGLAAASIFCGALYQPLPKRMIKRSRSEMQQFGESMPVRMQLRQLLMSPSYIVVCLAGSFIMMGYFAPFGFLKDSATPYIGKDNAVFLLTILGIANAVGRVLFGLLANKIGHSLLISNVALTVGGLITIFYPFATTHLSLIMFSIVFGLYAAVFTSLRSVIIKKVVGEEKFNVGFGLSLMFMGIATFFSNSLGGYLYEVTKKFDLSFYVAGGFIILSAVICYPLPWIYQWEKTKKSVSTLSVEEYQSNPRKSLVDIYVNK